MVNRIRNPKRISTNQDGLVAIFSVMIIMGILTLLTIGFTNITRQAQQRTLNDALKTQAFYAAEAGVNGAITAINDGTLPPATDNCLGMNGVVNYTIDAGRGIAITCLLVSPAPSNLEYSNVPVAGSDEPIVAELTSASGIAIDSLRFEWDTPQPTDGFVGHPVLNSGPYLDSEANWGTSAGIVRVELIPASVGPSNRSGMVNNSYVFQLYPTTNAGVPVGASASVGPGLANQGATFHTNCASAGDYKCLATIGLTSATNSYYMRLYTYYNPVRLRITPLNNGDEVALSNGQAQIDSTGRASDVYRRIQVRVPLNSEDRGYHNVFSLFSGDSICKKYVGVPGDTRTESPCSY